ncbi:MAG: hypothetical protein GC165_00145 [Armatimonadetes bacterium]|nr:hypothetical protein [Armatimonadota bacterium]
MNAYAHSTTHQPANPPRRTAPFSEEPGFYEPASLWLYGNSRLLGTKLAMVSAAFGPTKHNEVELWEIEKEAQEIVLGGQTLVTGVNGPAHQRAATVPLRWGAPRILVVQGGFYAHLGPNLSEEPFRTARLWRYEFDFTSDLIISRQGPDHCKNRKEYLPSVDNLIRSIVDKFVPGLLFE